MNRQNTDLPTVETRSGLTSVPPEEAIDPPTHTNVSEEADLDELLNYKPVPRPGDRTVLVQILKRGRLGPLAYALDEDDSSRWNPSGSK